MDEPRSILDPAARLKIEGLMREMACDNAIIAPHHPRRDKEARAAAPAQGTYDRRWPQIAAAAAAAAPAPARRTLEVSGAPHPELPSGVEAALYGLSILAAAALLIWAIEVAGRSSPPR